MIITAKITHPLVFAAVSAAIWWCSGQQPGLAASQYWDTDGATAGLQAGNGSNWIMNGGGTNARLSFALTRTALGNWTNDNSAFFETNGTSLVAVSGGDPSWTGPGGTVSAPTTGNWNASANWSPSGVPASGAALSFGGSGSTSYTSTNDISATYVLGAVSLTSTASVAEIIAGMNFNLGSGSSISQDNTGAFNIQNTMGGQNTAQTLTLTGNGTGLATLSGVISEQNVTHNVSITKTGTSTFVLSGASTYTGATNISAGTLTVDNNNATTARLANTSSITVNSGGVLNLTQGGATSSSNRINDSATITLAGGTFRLSGVAEGTSAAAGVGALSLTSTSTIDLASTCLLHFAASNLQTWTGTFKVYNWSGIPVTGGGAEQLLFGTNVSGLTPVQLTQIQFYSDAGLTPFLPGALILPSGEIVPVPEPSVWASLVVGLLVIAVTQRRQLLQRGKADCDSRKPQPRLALSLRRDLFGYGIVM